MAELGVIASIVGVAGAGFRLSLYLSAISCEVANAPMEIHHISKTVTLYSTMLNQIASVLQAADSVHSQEATKTAQQVASERQQVFGEIQGMIEKCRTRSADGESTISIQQRFKWCFKKNRVQYLLGQLESLKLSLSLMLQIIQLGKIMAATSKTDPPEVVEVKKDEISRGRLDVQNVIIVMHMQNEHVGNLFQTCDKDEPESPLELCDSNESQLTIEAPPGHSETVLVSLPLRSLGEFDQMLQGMRNSPRDMVQLSEKVIDPLLEKWTRWHQIREARHAQSTSRFVPHVDNLNEDDEDAPLHNRYSDHDDSPRGYYLEGTTTDWRQPHSVAARQEFATKKKRYSGYQPSVSAVSSDMEHSPGSNTSKKRQPRHIIDSSSDSSDSECEKTHVRKDSGFAGQERSRTEERPDRPRSLQSAVRGPSVPNPKDSRSTLSPQHIPMQQRPYPTPDQQHNHHSYTTPLPPIYTHNTTHQISAPSSPSNPPSYYTHLQSPVPRHQPAQQPQNRYPPRPSSRDGNPRSSSRYSLESSRSHRKPPEKRPSKDSKTRNLRIGATQGLLGAGAIAGFLEALECLTL